MLPPRKPPRGARLGDAEKRTHAALFRHPAPDDLAWGDVLALLGCLAEVEAGRKGSYKVTRNGVLITLHAPRARAALTADELSEVKGFLERSEAGTSAPVVAEGTRVLVALDSGGARLYRLALEGGEPRGLEAFEANGYAAYLRSTGAPSGGAAPVRLGFYKDLARALRGADEILLVASGPAPGDASALLEALRGELRRSHADVHRAVVGALVLPGRRTSEERLLASAREFYAAR